MGNLTAERVETDIRKLFVRYQELTEERRILSERIRKAESAKQTVSDRVYQRVYKEYQSKLQRVEEEVEPLRNDIERARASIENEMREVQSQAEDLKDRIDELEFRSRIGEFDETALGERRSPLAEKYAQLVRRHREIAEQITSIRHEPPAEPIPPAKAQAKEPAAEPGTKETLVEQLAGDLLRSFQEDPGVVRPPDASKERSDSPRAKSDAASVFIDPTEWVGEVEKEESRDAAAAELRDEIEKAGDAKPERRATAEQRHDAEKERHDAPATRAGAAGSLSNLADPSDDSQDGEKETGTQPSQASGDHAAPAGLPVLTITKGVGAGKKLPLLPMTMTLGREVDNNIELKDLDVARYHARVSFEAGHYVIQDLEGSSGTFVNGERITKTTLAPGAMIRVGATEMRFELG